MFGVANRRRYRSPLSTKIKRVPCDNYRRHRNGSKCLDVPLLRLPRVSFVEDTTNNKSRSLSRCVTHPRVAGGKRPESLKGVCFPLETSRVYVKVRRTEWWWLGWKQGEGKPDLVAQAFCLLVCVSRRESLHLTYVHRRTVGVAVGSCERRSGPWSSTRKSSGRPLTETQLS